MSDTPTVSAPSPKDTDNTVTEHINTENVQAAKSSESNERSRLRSQSPSPLSSSDYQLTELKSASLPPKSDVMLSSVASSSKDDEYSNKSQTIPISEPSPTQISHLTGSTPGSLSQELVTTSTPQPSTFQAVATNIKTTSPFLADEPFQLRLIEAIRSHPCLYDPNHEHHGNKIVSATYRSQVWQNIARHLKWQDDSHSLQVQWKRLRDRYVRRKKRDSSGSSGGIEDRANPILDALRFLQPFITEGSSSDRPPRESSQPQSQTSGSSHQSLQQHNTSSNQSGNYKFKEFYIDNQNQNQPLNQDVMLSGYSHNAQRSSTSQVSEQLRPNGNGVFIVRPTVSTNSGPTTIRLHTTGENPGRVGTGRVLTPMKAPSGMPPGTRVIALHTARTQSQQLQTVQTSSVSTSTAGSAQSTTTGVPFETSRISTQDPDITVTASGSAGMIGEIKKDSSAGSMMMLDPNFYVQSGSSKVYRVVSMNDMDHTSGARLTSSPPRKRLALMPSERRAGSPIQSLMPTTPTPDSNQLTEEIIIDDNMDENSVIIDPAQGPESPLLSDSPDMGQMMISGQHPRHIRMGQDGMFKREVNQEAMMMSHGDDEAVPGYMHQNQYDADLAFQHLISSTLARMSDEDKAMTKFNIQRILLDARFGAGMTARVIQEDDSEMSEAAVGNVAGHELVSN